MELRAKRQFTPPGSQKAWSSLRKGDADGCELMGTYSRRSRRMHDAGVFLLSSASYNPLISRQLLVPTSLNIEILVGPLVTFSARMIGQRIKAGALVTPSVRRSAFTPNKAWHTTCFEQRASSEPKGRVAVIVTWSRCALRPW